MRSSSQRHTWRPACVLRTSHAPQCFAAACCSAGVGTATAFTCLEHFLPAEGARLVRVGVAQVTQMHLFVHKFMRMHGNVFWINIAMSRERSLSPLACTRQGGFGALKSEGCTFWVLQS